MPSHPPDLRDLPNYTIEEVASYSRVPRSTVRAWAVGQPGFRAAIEIAERSPPTLSFWNLIEVYILASIRREHRIPLQKTRKALVYVERRLGVSRPLIREQFYTDGVRLFVERCSELISASEQGQTWTQAVRGALERIERDPQGIAARLHPWISSPKEDSRPFEIDPERASGRMVLTGTGIPVSILAGRFRAGDSVEGLAADYRIDRSLVESALRYALESRAA